MKCKHGSAGSAGNNNHNTTNSNQLSKDSEKSLTTALKSIQAELLESKEDFEKLRGKIERLEVS